MFYVEKQGLSCFYVTKQVHGMFYAAKQTYHVFGLTVLCCKARLIMFLCSITDMLWFYAANKVISCFRVEN